MKERGFRYVALSDDTSVKLYEDEFIVEERPGELTALIAKEKDKDKKYISTIERAKKGITPPAFEKTPEQRSREARKAAITRKEKEAIKRGVEDVSSIVRGIMTSPDLAEAMAKNKKFPDWAQQLDEVDGLSLTISAVMMNAMKGDVRAAEFLMKTAGWMKSNGDVIINAGTQNNFFQDPIINFEVVNPGEDIKTITKETQEGEIVDES